MLKVQRYLREGNPLEALTADLGIAVYRHAELPLVGLKYQSHAPKAWTASRVEPGNLDPSVTYVFELGSP